MSCMCLKHNKGASQAGHHESVLASPSTPYRVRVVIVHADGAELRGDAAAIREELPGFSIRAHPELVGQRHVADRGGAGTHNHLGEESRVDDETKDGEEQQHDQRRDQPQQHPVSHDGHLVRHSS